MFPSSIYPKLSTKRRAFVIVKKLKRQIEHRKVCPKCRNLVALFRKKIVIIVDESYFPLSNINLSGNAGCYTSDPDATPNDVKLKRKRKHEPKLLVWVALFENGVSKHYIAPSGEAVYKEVYISKCLVKSKKFINEVHKNDEIVFWPVLASAH